SSGRIGTGDTRSRKTLAVDLPQLGRRVTQVRQDRAFDLFEPPKNLFDVRREVLLIGPLQLVHEENHARRRLVRTLRSLPEFDAAVWSRVALGRETDRWPEDQRRITLELRFRSELSDEGRVRAPVGDFRKSRLVRCLLPLHEMTNDHEGAEHGGGDKNQATS